MNFYPNPDGPANHTGSSIGDLYKITPKKTIRMKITTNKGMARDCIGLRFR